MKFIYAVGFIYFVTNFQDVNNNLQFFIRVFHKQLSQTHCPVQQTKKKDAVKNENKLKAFIKRSSEPLLHGSTPQNQQQVE